MFSHYLVSVKNRNSPVTFTLHFLIIYIYVHGFILIILIVLNVFINSLQKKRKFAIKCIYSSRKMCLVTMFFFCLKVEADGDVQTNEGGALHRSAARREKRNPCGQEAESTSRFGVSCGVSSLLAACSVRGIELAGGRRPPRFALVFVAFRNDTKMGMSDESRAAEAKCVLPFFFSCFCQKPAPSIGATSVCGSAACQRSNYRRRRPPKLQDSARSEVCVSCCIIKFSPEWEPRLGPLKTWTPWARGRGGAGGRSQGGPILVQLP